VKHIFAGSRRVAQIEGRLAGGNERGWQILSFTPGWNFFSLDVEPDDPSITEALGSLAGKYSQLWAFDPVDEQYKGHVPALGMNDLTEIHAQQAYIIQIDTRQQFSSPAQEKRKILTFRRDGISSPALPREPWH